MHPLPRLLTCAALLGTLAACGGDGTTDPGAAPQSGDTVSEQPAGDTSTSSEQSGDTSMPAEDVTPTGEVTRGEAEAVANAYLGMTESEAQAQSEIDQRVLRVGARDGEQLVLTEDYQLGRITVTVEGGEVTEATVESSDGPVTASQ